MCVMIVFVCLCAVITKMCYDRTVIIHPQNGEKKDTHRTVKRYP